MKVAILVCGNVRTWELGPRQSLIQTFLPLKPDIYMVTERSKYKYHPYIHSMYGYPKTLEMEEIDTSKLLTPELEPFVRRVVVEEVEGEEREREKFSHEMKEIWHGFFQYAKFQKAVEVLSHFLPYDIIIKVRFDLCYHISNLEELLLAARDNRIIIHESDHIFIGTPKLLLDLPQFVLNEYMNPTSPLSWQNPPHGLFQHYVDKHGIKAVEHRGLCHIERLINPPCD